MRKSAELAEICLSGLLQILPRLYKEHARNSQTYAVLSNVSRACVEELFSGASLDFRQIEPFGQIAFPYWKMGAVDSLNLFDLDELIIFSYYYANRARYKKVADLGANIGAHANILAKCGYSVKAYEPDPVHFAQLKDRLKLNKAEAVTPFQTAVSTGAGNVEFVRVVGNTTGSHIAGAKENPYGELERFSVETIPFAQILSWADLIKMDVEGHEKEILLSTKAGDWQSCDLLVEISSDTNARAIFEHMQKCQVNLFAQKLGWGKVEKLDDMPKSYKEGTLFISAADKMHWLD